MRLISLGFLQGGSAIILWFERVLRIRSGIHAMAGRGAKGPRGDIVHTRELGKLRRGSEHVSNVWKEMSNLLLPSPREGLAGGRGSGGEASSRDREQAKHLGSVVFEVNTRLETFEQRRSGDFKRERASDVV